jgi:hypothetical protein
MKDTEKLKQQADMMNVALTSTHSEEKAREVLQGKLQDVYFVKIRIDTDSKSGVVLALYSIVTKRILFIYSFFGSNPIFRKIRTFEDIKQISESFVEIQKNGGTDPTMTDLAGKAFYRIFNDTPQIESWFPIWDKKEVTVISDQFQRAANTNMKGIRCKVTAEVEKTTSVKILYNNPLNGVLNPVNPAAALADEVPAPQPDAPKSAAEPKKDLTPLQRQIEFFSKNFQTQVSCSTILSPVAGMEFDELIAGQELLFKLPHKTQEELSRANHLGAIDDKGNVNPVVGRYIGIASGKNEYHIFAEGPKAVLLHAIEERPVKLAVPKNTVRLKEETESEMNPLNIFIIAASLIVVALVLYLVLG